MGYLQPVGLPAPVLITSHFPLGKYNVCRFTQLILWTVGSKTKKITKQKKAVSQAAELEMISPPQCQWMFSKDFTISVLESRLESAGSHVV